MSKHTEKVLALLSRKELYNSCISIIDAAQKSNRDEEQLTIFLTVGEFKTLDGFYASRGILLHLTSAYIARLIKMYCEEMGVNPSSVLTVFRKVEPAQEGAVADLMKHFILKYGPVDEKRVEELNDIADAWELQAQLKIKTSLEREGDGKSQTV